MCFEECHLPFLSCLMFSHNRLGFGEEDHRDGLMASSQGHVIGT